MREIKFRAWIEQSKKMIDVDVLAINPVSWKSGGTGVSLAYQPQTKVMQYTGLKDNSGTEIYEGDIVEWKYHSGTRVLPMNGYDNHIEDYESEIYKVVFQDGAFKLFSEIYGTKYLRIPQSELEVIGNIYEHEHLLKGVTT